MKAILFDFGGTLDTNGIHWSEKYWEAYEFLNLPVTKKQYEESYIYSESKMNEVIKPDDTFRITIYYQVMFQLMYLKEKKYFDDTVDPHLISKISNKCYFDVIKTAENNSRLLDTLSRNYKLAVVSNFYGNLVAVLKELSLYKYFETVIDSFHAGIKKPDPGIFRLAVNKLNVSPKETFVVGDSYDRDIQPGKSIGCSTIWLDGKSWTRPDNTDDADIIIKSLEELSQRL